MRTVWVVLYRDEANEVTVEVYGEEKLAYRAAEQWLKSLWVASEWLGEFPLSITQAMEMWNHWCLPSEVSVVETVVKEE